MSCRKDDRESSRTVTVCAVQDGIAACAHIDGDFDEAAADQLPVVLAQAWSENPALAVVVVDLANVGLITAAGIAALHTICDNTLDALEVRIAARGPALRSLHAAGFGDDIAVYPTREAALASLMQADDDAPLREQLAQREEQLASLPVIEQAKGMLIQDFGLADDEAFATLMKLSQETNVKLREIADHLVAALSGTVSGETAVTSLDTITTLRDRLRRHIGARRGSERRPGR